MEKVMYGLQPLQICAASHTQLQQPAYGVISETFTYGGQRQSEHSRYTGSLHEVDEGGSRSQHETHSRH